MAEYRLTPAALHDLETIWQYSQQKWGVDKAQHYTDSLAVAFSDLLLFPEAAPACDHIRSGYRKRNVERHVIYFRITNYGILIVRILHHRMDVGSYL